MTEASNWTLFLGMVLVLTMFSSCRKVEPRIETQVQFNKLASSQTGIDFNNQIEETEALNYFIHSGFYNGAGLATGDLNNDGLPDLFFCGNQVSNQVYVNKGDLKFDNITPDSGIESDLGWCTGATMADIDADGYLDIYICRYFASKEGQSTKNLLYINNGNLTFSEKGEEFGIADTGNSVHATFLDYDLDGDLDLYVLNQPTGFRKEKLDLVAPDNWNSSDRLYRNDGGTFLDVTEQAGILNFAYGLSAVVGDVNNDGYPDIFVGNDYEAPDHMYLNNRKGGFNRVENDVFGHISNYSMGADIADFNNDGWLDIFVADMLAEHHYRQKANMGAMNAEKFNSMVAAGMHHQYMRNMLHMNNKLGSFSEIGQMAGVSKTDWSWASLFADFDNDGLQDLYVTNGILRDVRNNDAQKLAVDNTLEHTRNFPSQPMANVMFRNKGNLDFKQTSELWGLGDPGFSNGAVYVDLDNDGDLDIVTNNVNAEAGIYENNNLSDGSWIQVEAKGISGNPRGRGVKVMVHTKSGDLYQENTIERGYMSGLTGIMHFGLGNASEVESIEILWPRGTKQFIDHPQINSRLVVKENDAIEEWTIPVSQPPLFVSRHDLKLDRRHEENECDDFESQVLLPHKMSTFGPGIAVGDVNGDGADDFYIGGASGQAGSLYVKQEDGKFRENRVSDFEADEKHEDMGVLLLDIDGDEDLDLYVVSGGNCLDENSDLLLDRIYVNDGNGNFQRDESRLPELRTSGSCVVAADYDGDGDLDLFVGGRHVPGRYPIAPESYLLENDNGSFVDITGVNASDLRYIGMVSDALWSDVDDDGLTDLLIVGEWMPITIFMNTGGNLVHSKELIGLDNSQGWWNSISGGDFDKDGDVDYVVGNHGLNSKFHVSEESPLQLYSMDFDNDEALDIVLAKSDSGRVYPVRGRECSSQQIPEIEEKFADYHSFASATLDEIYSKEKLREASHYQATNFTTSLIQNNQNKRFEIIPLPVDVQVSATFGTIVHDFNLDGNLDILYAGNFYAPEVETGRQDAGMGGMLIGNGNGGFAYEDGFKTGFECPTDARSLVLAYDNIFPLILVGNNDSNMQAFTYINASGEGDRFQPGETHADLVFKDGRTQRIENYHGNSYLSSSSQFIQTGPYIEKIVFYHVDGVARTYLRSGPSE